MRKILLVSFLFAQTLSFSAWADDTASPQKSDNIAKRGVEATERGASSAGKAVGKGLDKVNEKVLKPADHWIQSKVNPKGTPTPPRQDEPRP